jgi:hypothetical protein
MKQTVAPDSVMLQQQKAAERAGAEQGEAIECDESAPCIGDWVCTNHRIGAGR